MIWRRKEAGTGGGGISQQMGARFQMNLLLQLDGGKIDLAISGAWWRKSRCVIDRPTPMLILCGVGSTKDSKCKSADGFFTIQTCGRLLADSTLNYAAEESDVGRGNNESADRRG